MSFSWASYLPYSPLRRLNMLYYAYWLYSYTFLMIWNQYIFVIIFSIIRNVHWHYAIYNNKMTGYRLTPQPARTYKLNKPQLLVELEATWKLTVLQLTLGLLHMVFMQGRRFSVLFLWSQSSNHQSSDWVLA
jgi:hypothetical protein